MTAAESGVVLLCGGLGFVSVWYFIGQFSRRKPALEAPTPEQNHDAGGHWFEILGVAENADWSDIKTGYLREIARYHPDKFAALDAEFGEIASRRAKMINDAYETAKRLKGQR